MSGKEAKLLSEFLMGGGMLTYGNRFDCHFDYCVRNFHRFPPGAIDLLMLFIKITEAS